MMSVDVILMFKLLATDYVYLAQLDKAPLFCLIVDHEAR